MSSLPCLHSDTDSETQACSVCAVTCAMAKRTANTLNPLAVDLCDNAKTTISEQ